MLIFFIALNVDIIIFLSYFGSQNSSLLGHVTANQSKTFSFELGEENKVVI